MKLYTYLKPVTNRKIVVSFLLLISCTFLFAQQNDNGKKNKFQLTENSYSSMSFSLSTLEFSTAKIKTPYGFFTELSAVGLTSSNILGEAKLPVMRKLIEIPLDATPEVHITNYTVKEFALSDFGGIYPVIPAQPPISKSLKPEEIKFSYNAAAYQVDEYTNRPLVSVDIIGIMRGLRVGRVTISPVKYNPVKNTLSVYENIEAEIVFKNGNVSKTLQLKKDKYSPYFETSYHTIVNYKPIASKDVISTYPVKYVIVSDTMFYAQLQPFVQWKTRKGFNVVQVYTSNPAVGNSTASIKNYLKNLYNAGTAEDPAPSFILLCGDIAQVPAFSGTTGAHVTDLYYSEYTNDFLPEVYYGRFSATNVSELQPQLDKTLQYEQYLMPDPSFLNQVVMIAGEDGTHAPTWGDGQINYGTSNYFNLAHGLTSHTYLNPSGSHAAQIIQDVSAGVGYANYTAHGGSDGWSNPAFSNTDIISLQNENKYPLMVGNCCLTNKFDEPLCFGEALLRASKKGALGYIGGSNSSYWDEDYWWGCGNKAVSVNPTYDVNNLGAYDKTFHEHGEPYADWFMTQGQMVVGGNLAVTQSASTSFSYYWEIYHLMGDPSLMVYFSVPPALSVSYTPLLSLGATTFTVNADPYAYAAISMNNILYGAALADSMGVAVITLKPFATPGIAEVVVTKQNRQPYINTIAVQNPVGPYMIYSIHEINDSAANNNDNADFGENILLNVSVRNVGNALDPMVNGVLSTNDTLVSITDSLATWSNIDSSQTALLNNAFAFTVKNYVPDQHTVHFLLRLTDNLGHSWDAAFNVKLNAPILTITNIMIDDSLTGNNNKRLDLGETAKLYITTKNIGHADAVDALSSITSASSYITLNGPLTFSLNTLLQGETDEAQFSVTANAQTPMGSIVDFNYNVVSSPYYAEKIFYKSIGVISEDWETNTFQHYAWQQGGTAPWIITNVNPYESQYCAKSADSLLNNQTSELSITLNVLSNDSVSFYRKVSSEANYDFLTFYIDGNKMDEWAGEVAWAKTTYSISSGNHTLSWIYAKDFSADGGSNCAWLDYIELPPFNSLVSAPVTESSKPVLLNIYPNPLNGKANILLSLPKEDRVSISVFNDMGQKTATVLNENNFSEGAHSIEFDASSLRSGVYTFVVNTNEKVINKRVVIY